MTLKLKEVSYIHAKAIHRRSQHGPNALIDFRCAGDDRDFIATTRVRDPVRKSQQHGRLQEQRNRDCAGDEGDTIIPQFADHTIFIPTLQSCCADS